MFNFMSSLINPYKFAKQNDIHVITEHLGKQIATYYHCTSGIKLIHINEAMPKNAFIKRIFISYFIYKAAEERTNKDKISIIPVDNMFNSVKSMTM